MPLADIGANVGRPGGGISTADTMSWLGTAVVFSEKIITSDAPVGIVGDSNRSCSITDNNGTNEVSIR